MKEVIIVLSEVIDIESLREAKESLLELEGFDYVIEELDHIEDNFEDSCSIRQSIKLLIESIENDSVVFIKNPSLRDLEQATKFIDKEKLLVKNMVQKTKENTTIRCSSNIY